MLPFSLEVLMNVLSLFDGISCGRVALERARIDVGRYYASEIDQRAMAVSRHNYPDIIQLGEVSTVCPHSLPRIDLLLAGSPCQGFSYNGKQKGFDDPRSKLFWEFVRILKATKPMYFLLENVSMKKEWRDIITDAVGVEPVFINSSCLSAQSRPRWYWTNLPRIALPPPELGLTLADILEKPAAVSRLYPNEIAHSLDGRKRTCIVGRVGRNNYGQAERVYSTMSVSPTLSTYHPPKVSIASYSGQRPCVRFPRQNKETKMIGRANRCCFNTRDRVYGTDGKSPCLNTLEPPIVGEKVLSEEPPIQSGNSRLDTLCVIHKDHWRELTPVECERLQPLDDGYTACLSDNQRYKALGNGWTVDVIAYLLRGIS